MKKDIPPARSEREDTQAFVNGNVDEVPGWQELGSCWDTYDDSFFTPEVDDMLVVADICYNDCPVRLQCLRSAIGFDEKRIVQPGGVWGGYVPEQRRRLRTAILSRRG